MRRHGKRVKVTVEEKRIESLQAAAERAERNYVLGRTPVMNLDKVIEFELDGMRLVRRLVPVVHEIGKEISVASPVGFKLANAKAGDQFVIARPNSEDGYSVVKVLSIADSVAQGTA